MTERRDVVSAFFFFSAILSFLKWRESSARRWYAATLALYALALLSKGTAITLPAVLLILAVYPLRQLGGTAGWWTAAARRLYLSMIPFAVLGLAATAVTFTALQPMPQLEPAGKVAVSAYSLAFYIWKSVLPAGLSPLYAMPSSVNALELRFIGSGIFVLAVAVSAWLARNRWPAVATALAVFFVVTFPMIGVHQNGPQIAADRYTYHSAPALAILAAGGIAAAISNARVLAAAGVGAWLLLGGLTWRQTGVWHDSRALWSRALTMDAQSPIAQNNWGNLLAEQDSVEQAVVHYERAVSLAPGYAQAHNGLGIALGRLGRADEATEQFRLALESEPGYDEPVNNWGAILAGQGKLDEAIARYQQAVTINPNNADAHVNWGNALVGLGRSNEAIDHYREALRIRPDHAEAHHNWGVALARARDYDGAMRQFDAALAINPNHREARRYRDLAERLAREKR